MPAPYDYRTRGVDVDNYFDAFRQGREDKLAGEADARNKSLAQYLPGALKGDAGMRDQAYASASPDQQIALTGTFAQIDAGKMAQVREKHGRFASLLTAVQNRQIPLDRAKQIAVSELGIDPQKVANVTEADIPAFIAQTQTVTEHLERADKERAFGLQERQFAETVRSNRAGEDIQRTNASNRAPSQRPLPQGVQTAEDADIKVIQGAGGINGQLGQYAELIDKGELNLGPGNNFLSGVQNTAGYSSVGSQNYALFVADLERLRNESLRLNSGPQTDTDARNAWNELIVNINDPKVVKRQIARIQDLNNKAVGFKKQSIDIRRARNNADPFDFGALGIDGSAAPAPPAPAAPAAPAQAAPPAVGKVVNRGGTNWRFLGGDPRDPKRWRREP